MAKATRVSAAGRNAALDAVGALMNGGRMELRSGTVPADESTAPPDGLVLSNHDPLLTPAFAAAAAGVMNANAIPDDPAADNGGSASYARIYRSAANGGACVWQGTAGTSNANAIVDTDPIVAGRRVRVLSLSLSLPNNSTG